MPQDETLGENFSPSHWVDLGRGLMDETNVLCLVPAKVWQLEQSPE